jgi:hypothetical protein
MKYYLVEFSSPCNAEQNREITVRANSIVEAQDKFFAWLKGTNLYQHMWELNMAIREVEHGMIE